MELIFSPAVISLCANVSIVNDSVLESTEQFSVELSTADFDVIFVNSSASVIIFDDDRKFNSSIDIEVTSIFISPSTPRCKNWLASIGV